MIYVDEECRPRMLKKKSEHRWPSDLSRQYREEEYNLCPFPSGYKLSLFYNPVVTVAVHLQFEALYFLTHVFARDANGKSIFVATVSANNRV